MSQIAPSSGPARPLKRLRFTQSPRLWLYALWKFSRPHTIIGTSLSVLGLFAIVWAEASADLAFRSRDLIAPAIALLACLAGNVYIVGLNQLEDVEIDRINKPHLPLASGEFSRRDGRWIVGLLGALSAGPSGLGRPVAAAAGGR